MYFFAHTSVVTQAWNFLYIPIKSMLIVRRVHTALSVTATADISRFFLPFSCLPESCHILLNGIPADHNDYAFCLSSVVEPHNNRQADGIAAAAAAWNIKRTRNVPAWAIVYRIFRGRLPLFRFFSAD